MAALTSEPDAPAAEAAPLPATPPVLPESFWLARSWLGEVRDYARARRAAPDAVLLQLFARIGAQSPAHAGVVTGYDSEPSPLSLFVVSIGPSGAGKTSSTRVARRLTPVDLTVPMDTPIGSGEGIAEAYMGEVPDGQPSDNPSKKPKTKRVQVFTRAHFHVDECEAITRLVKRDGATLGETLRRAFAGEALGHKNASAERARHVVDYVLGLSVNATPGAIVGLLAYAELGLPQRFLWASALDPDAPRFPDHARMPVLPSVGELPITCAPAVVEAIQEPRWLALRGELQTDELDSHAVLIRARAAALVTALDGRAVVEGDDWQLAGMILGTSGAVRSWAIARAEDQQADTEAADAERRGRVTQTVRAMAAETDSVLARIAERIAGRVHRVGSATTRHLNRACTKAADRHLFGAALSLAVASGRIIVGADGTYRPVGVP